MSSIIEGYEYDIFISYRQKDNKGDRWVTEDILNKTQYRNQVNKLANAIKEIVANLKNSNNPVTPASIYSTPAFKSEITSKSIAVLPFVNMSSDPEQELFPIQLSFLMEK